jgi:putative PIN family toxin of toxin-antitoxin system
VIVVLDTNVWISARIWSTPDRTLFRALAQDQLAISDFIRTEIEQVLTQKFDRDPVELQVVLEELLAQALRIKVTGGCSRRTIYRDLGDFGY